MSINQTARPLFDNLLIRPLSKKKEMASGIALPDSKDNSEVIEGVVLATGKGITLPVVLTGIGGLTTLATQPVLVKVSEHVVFRPYAGTPIKLNGEKLWLVNQKDVLSVIEYETR